MTGLIVSIILVAAELAFRVGLAVVILLRKQGDSTSRLAWLLVVLIFPVVGTVLYLLVGDVRLGRRRIRRHKEVVLRKSHEAAIRPRQQAAHHTTIHPPYTQIASLAETVGGTIPCSGNTVKLLGDTKETIDSIVTDINEATEHCHVLTYIYLDDDAGSRVAHAMMSAKERGVECRVLVDAVGSSDFLDSNLCSLMRKSGIEVVAALPVNTFRALFARIDLRNHRKIAVIDSKIGYTGSQNIAEADFAPKKRFAPWVDATVRVEGPIVTDLQQLFVEDWYLDTKEWLSKVLESRSSFSEDGVTAQLIGTGPNAYTHAMRQVNHAAIHLAREELILTTPYFVPDEAMVSALITASRRGVSTELVLPARNDSILVAASSRSYFEPLLNAGVRIHTYQSGLLHAKTLTVDRDMAMVSSANFDRRSFLLNFEASLIVYDSDFASQLRFLQTSYIDDSIEIDLNKWTKRKWPRGMLETLPGYSALYYKI